MHVHASNSVGTVWNFPRKVTTAICNLKKSRLYREGYYKSHHIGDAVSSGQ